MVKRNKGKLIGCQQNFSVSSTRNGFGQPRFSDLVIDYFNVYKKKREYEIF